LELFWKSISSDGDSTDATFVRGYRWRHHDGLLWQHAAPRTIRWMYRPGRKDATLACWRSFADIGQAAETRLGKNAKGTQIAAAYTQAASEIDRLPLLDVDPDLTSLLSKFSRDFRELGAVYSRLATRREDINHGLNKIGESFLRGFAGDPFGTFREEMASDRADNAALEEIKSRLRANVAELSSLRGQLTSRYQVEFPPVE
jgi:hypothetical protein